MSLPPHVDRSKPRDANQGQSSKWLVKPFDYLLGRSMLVTEIIAFFNRLPRVQRAVPILQPAVPLTDLDQASETYASKERAGLNQPLETYVAKEKFERGHDVVVFGDELYRWRPEFEEARVYANYIALRRLEIGEEVIYDPNDPNNSGLMLHWGFNFNSES